MDLIDFMIFEPGWTEVHRELDRLHLDYLSKAARSKDHDQHTANRGAFEAIETLKASLAKLRRDTLKEP